MGFSQWKKKYPFLGEILTLYDKLDQSVLENDPNEEILNLCNRGSTFNTDLTKDQEITCKKLLRNFFFCIGLGPDKFINCCSNLYIWLYYEMNNSGISNHIIKKIFEFPNSAEKRGHTYFPCPYDTFNDEIDNAENLMKLSIFNNNAASFQSMLKDSEKSKDCHLNKYVYECVDIYNTINKTYGFPPDCNGIQQKNTCEIINAFSGYYRSFILNKEGISPKFPELSSDVPLKYMDDCPLERSKPDTVPEQTKQETPTTRGAATALSSMVGIPPFLILMYKFTPVRNLFRFGKKKHTIITNDFDKKMENELFHVINEDSNIKDIQPKYNIGYEPA